MESNTDRKSDQGCIRWRYLTAILCFFVFLFAYCMRSNISVAIVDMVKSNDSNSQNDSQSGEFDWSSSTQGLILSSFYWGYILPQIAAGRLADKFGPKYLLLAGGSLGAIMTLLAPVAARFHVGCLIATRAFCGLGLGVLYPCFNAIIAKWSLRSERSFFTGFIASGSTAGSVVAMPLAGILCSSNAGWPWAFYLFGIIFAIFLLLWTIFIYNYPKDHPWISNVERMNIEKSLDEVINFERNPPVPWKTLLRTKAVWAIIIVNFANGWGYYTMLSELPTYMNDVLGFDISENGLYSALPYLAALIVGNISAYTSDFIIRHKFLKVVTTRKLFTVVALYTGAGCLLAVTFINGQQTMVIYALLVLSIGLEFIYYGGFLVNHIDLVPNFAGTVVGITTTVGSIPGIISPYITGIITDSKSDSDSLQHSWCIVFYISCSILFTGATLYFIFAEGELLPWNDITKQSVTTDNKSTPVKDIVNKDHLPEIKTPEYGILIQLSELCSQSVSTVI